MYIIELTGIIWTPWNWSCRIISFDNGTLIMSVRWLLADCQRARRTCKGSRETGHQARAPKEVEEMAQK